MTHESRKPAPPLTYGTMKRSRKWPVMRGRGGSIEAGAPKTRKGANQSILDREINR